ncbi:hypothetical protein [Aestuariibacter salexigens]|uniref:hypothetical protein n=1 Tax=Aestuariibacter salexigens TaxID=226010 RepID=UPI000425ABC7|nr:hypothetical protein [Aestuariibacter salexigens]
MFINSVVLRMLSKVKNLIYLASSLLAFYHTAAQADYALGCKDPAYLGYVEQRFIALEAKDRRSYEQTRQNYELTVKNGANAYRTIASLTRHLFYSAQFDPLNDVAANIDLLFEHADAMSVEQQIAGDVFDNFSTETHAVGIARAWLAYRLGNEEAAFKALFASLETANSALLGAFGPDFSLVRQLYRDGHVEPVVDYIENTASFWTGKRPDALRKAWLTMIRAGCLIQFDSVDTIKAAELGLY